ncbi:hypothetical protein MHBO_002892, partial [Bonamia ostreae]
TAVQNFNISQGLFPALSLSQNQKITVIFDPSNFIQAPPNGYYPLQNDSAFDPANPQICRFYEQCISSDLENFGYSVLYQGHLSDCRNFCEKFAKEKNNIISIEKTRRLFENKNKKIIWTGKSATLVKSEFSDLFVYLLNSTDKLSKEAVEAISKPFFANNCDRKKFNLKKNLLAALKILSGDNKSLRAGSSVQINRKGISLEGTILEMKDQFPKCPIFIERNRNVKTELVLRRSSSSPLIQNISMANFDNSENVQFIDLKSLTPQNGEKINFDRFEKDVLAQILRKMADILADFSDEEPILSKDETDNGRILEKRTNLENRNFEETARMCTQKIKNLNKIKKMDLMLIKLSKSFYKDEQIQIVLEILAIKCLIGNFGPIFADENKKMAQKVASNFLFSLKNFFEEKLAKFYKNFVDFKKIVLANFGKTCAKILEKLNFSDKNGENVDSKNEEFEKNQKLVKSLKQFFDFLVKEIETKFDGIFNEIDSVQGDFDVVKKLKIEDDLDFGQIKSIEKMIKIQCKTTLSEIFSILPNIDENLFEHIFCLLLKQNKFVEIGNLQILKEKMENRLFD